MKQSHFFKAYSRIGLTHAPIRREEPNIGVENGSSVILSEQFLDEVGEYEITDFNFTNPEDIEPKDYIEILTNQLVSFKNTINREVKDNELQVVVGGDNTVTFSSLLAVIERVGDVKKVGYIQFDSHGEINSFEGSDSKNFHGMYMRPFFDKFDISVIDELIPNKMNPSQMFVFGDQVLDGDEPEFYEQNNLHSITFDEYVQNKQKINQDLENFLKEYEYIHVNFDIDVFDQEVAGATGIPEDGKWQKAEIFELLTLIKNHQNISFDLSEINPQKEGSERTIKLAQEILKLIIK
jgi:arginase